jgi:DNA-binding IclR family transcriptional regulator
VAPANGRLQRLALHAISEAGKRGLTSQELAERTGVDFAASQPRTSELRRLGLIRDSGQRRKNRSGKQAIVWIAAEREAENG